MCGRYSICKSAKELETLFHAHAEDSNVGPVYNAAPTMLLPVVSMQESRKLQFFQWGISQVWSVSAAAQQLLINARAESVFEKKAFREWVIQNRCVIPADGFYEWTGKGKIRQPWRFSLKDGSVFAFAGLYAPVTDSMSKAKYSFCIITTLANEKVSPFHHRMPVVLNSRQAEVWLTATSKESLLSSLESLDSDALQVYAVSPKVNKAGVNTSDLIEPWQSQELTLF